MIVLGVALAVMLVASAVYLSLFIPTQRARSRLQQRVQQDIEKNRYANHVRSMEHELMITGHESSCSICIDKAERADYWREVEIAKSNAWEASERVDRAKVINDLFAARGDARRLKPIRDPRWEWIEVTKFGESEPSYVKGRRIV